MSNPFDEIRTAVREAKQQLEAVDRTATEMADLLKGRLRHCTGNFGKDVLRALKKELRDFDATTGKWKNS